jgi:hypothetical protein
MASIAATSADDGSTSPLSAYESIVGPDHGIEWQRPHSVALCGQEPPLRTHTLGCYSSSPTKGPACAN